MVRIHQFLVFLIVLIPATHEKFSRVTHLERELCFQNLLAYAKKGSRPYQLPPNSCTILQDPKCHAFSEDCWSFTELYKYLRIFLFLLPLLQGHHSRSVTNLTSGTSPPIHIWSSFTLNNGFQLNLLWLLQNYNFSVVSKRLNLYVLTILQNFYSSVPPFWIHPPSEFNSSCSFPFSGLLHKSKEFKVTLSHLPEYLIESRKNN